MADATADRADIVRSLIVYAIALVAGILVAWIIGGLFGLGAAPGLIFGAAVFLVLPYLIPAGRLAASASYDPAGAAAHAPVAAPSHEPLVPEPEVIAAPRGHAAAAAPLADLPVAPDGPGAAISERVREAARAAGEAARALAGDAGEPVGTRPATLAAPRGGEPDNLKRLRGVGPKFEVVLHELGIYHFDQIASWGPGEVAWIDANLEGFSGRVVREDWVGQAAILATGGETEHSQRVDRGEST